MELAQLSLSCSMLVSLLGLVSKLMVVYYWILSAECRTFILVEKFKSVCKS
jgi:hypothetical protein